MNDLKFIWRKAAQFLILDTSGPDTQQINLKLNRPGFSESGKCNFTILRPKTIKFGGVILCQKLYLEIINI